MEYTCELCNKTFKLKHHLAQHMNKKNSCVKEELQCCKCSKTFNSIYVLRRHLNKKISCKDNKYYTCSVCNKQYINKYVFNRHVKNDHKNQDATTINNTNNINNGTINNNNNTNCDTINNNINITLAFGQEQTDYLEKEEQIMKILNSGFKCMKQLIEDKHYNDEHPENHNICITDLRGRRTLIYNGKTWDVCNSDDIFDKLLCINRKYILAKYNTYKDILTEEANNTIKKILATITEKNGRFNVLNERYTGMVDTQYYKYKDDIQLIMYNNRNIIKKNVKPKGICKIYR
jgi:hypothetical protein